jgi:glutamate-1-semialdehyde 2,1-aminomutase
MSDKVSQELFARAKRLIPGGVNSPVRAFRAVGGEPVFVKEAHGATLVGADGTKYVDYLGSWGPMILGHAHPEVVRAISDAAAKGTTYGTPSPGEIDMAEAITHAFPSIEMVRLTSSGTEAVMGALRVARGFTKRDLIVKLEGCYHGGADYLLVKAGSGLATFGVPDSAGVPASVAATTLTIPYNDLAAARTLFSERGREIAALILEPVVGNMGLVAPAAGYLEGLRELTRANGALLVFDEVMTGFRLSRGGAQELYGIKPDLTTLGKIVGGGIPVGAYGGRREIMELIAPQGPVYQAGTLSGNPLAVAAGLTTLRLLSAPGTYEKLERLGAQVEKILVDAAQEASVPCVVQRVGSMLTPFFTEEPVRSWADANLCDRAAFGRFHATLIANGVYWPPSQFEAAFVSLAHDDAAFETTRRAARAAFEAAGARA